MFLEAWLLKAKMQSEGKPQVNSELNKKWFWILGTCNYLQKYQSTFNKLKANQFQQVNILQMKINWK